MTDTPADIWATVLRELGPNLRVWLEPFEAVGTEGNRLIIEGPSRNFDWASRRYGQALGDHVRRISEFEGIVIRRSEESAA